MKIFALILISQMIRFISSTVELKSIAQHDLLAGFSDALSHRKLLECVFLKETKMNVNMECEKEKDFSKLREKYSQIVSLIIVDILFLKHECNHLELEETHRQCKDIIRQALIDKFELKVNNHHEEHSLNVVVNDFFKYFRIVEFYRSKQGTKNQEKLDQIGKLISSDILRIKGEPGSDDQTDDSKDDGVLKRIDSNNSKMTESGQYNLNAIIDKKGLPNQSRSYPASASKQDSTDANNHESKILDGDSPDKYAEESQLDKRNTPKTTSLPVDVDNEIERKRKQTEKEMAQRVENESLKQVQKTREKQINEIKSQVAHDFAAEEEERRKKNEALEREKKGAHFKQADEGNQLLLTKEGGLLKEGSKKSESVDCKESAGNMTVTLALIVLLLSFF